MIHLPKPQLGLLSYLLTQQLYLGSQLQSNIVSFPGHDDCSATTLLENLVNFLGCTCNDCCLYSNCRSLTGSHCYNIKKKNLSVLLKGFLLPLKFFLFSKKTLKGKQRQIDTGFWTKSARNGPCTFWAAAQLCCDVCVWKKTSYIKPNNSLDDSISYSIFNACAICIEPVHSEIVHTLHIRCTFTFLIKNFSN